MITGMVYDRHSSVSHGGVAATTDEQGRYRLTGLPIGAVYRLFASPGEGSAYAKGSFKVTAAARALEPVTFDFALKRGVLIRGRLIDKVTGKPVLRGYIETCAFADNPSVKDYPGYVEGQSTSTRVGPDGRFTIAALPGRGLVAANADWWGYLKATATGFEKIKGFERQGDIAGFNTVPHQLHVDEWHAIIEVNPEDRAESIDVELQVDPGRTLTGMVVDPEGQPVTGALASGLNAGGDLRSRLPQLETFKVILGAGTKPHRAYFYHMDRKLAGSLVIRGDEKEPLIVQLQPWGTLTGRVVDGDGRPRMNAVLRPNYSIAMAEPFDPDQAMLPEQVIIAPDGRFRIEGLVPGLKYAANAAQGFIFRGEVFKDVRLEPGETRDLGDLKAVSPKEAGQ
jgi:hypothetical protein